MPQASLMRWLSNTAVREPPPPAHPDKPTIGTQPPARLGVDASLTPEQAPLPTTRDGPAPSIPIPSNFTLPPNIELRACSRDDIPSLKRLTGLLLPIPYPESFYREIYLDEVTQNLTLLAIWHDDAARRGLERGRLVGAIRCRLLARAPGGEDGGSSSGGSMARKTAPETGPMLYLSTLVLLSPYRGHGIAGAMLDVLVRRAVADYGVVSVGAHVWEANVEGLEWYRKRAFLEVGRAAGYYRRLNPQTALVMRRDIGVRDLLGQNAFAATAL